MATNSDYDSGREKEQNGDQAEKMKTKIMSVWNNVKYGWSSKSQTNFSYHTPIWLLGECYHHRPDDPNETEQSAEDDCLTPMERFKRDFTSRLWLTYRREFQQLAGTSLTTDCGWGCMLRSGQMMLAQSFLTHFLGRDWCLYDVETKEQIAYHRQIVKWFGDQPGEQSPFSVHRLVSLGHEAGKRPGDWYGPASVAHILKRAMDTAPKFDPLLNQLCVYIAQDCTVYKQDVINLCRSQRADVTDSRSSQLWCSVIILIPVRLGGEELNPVYISCIKSLFTLKHCIGIIGGKPKHSLYFIGFQEDKLIHLDPHLCQDVVDMRSRDFPLQSFHCMSPRKMSLMKMDPSCTIGFYCKTQDDFKEFCSYAQEVLDSTKHVGDYPMFIFSDGCSLEHQLPQSKKNKPDRLLRVRHLDSEGRPKSQVEEFVFL
ncbi:cysteine protease ATG4D-like [Saccoglossus kowalevskii]|uniref:Cysteine protease n=1 Tax=Saccoglossus kowalevskii TaxID=10224 RepID=A0ABM0MPV5_SACKO|nr:PREDICTED: cysteine protease ATG4D-like [Saccoglossus kowalevskii]